MDMEMVIGLDIGFGDVKAVTEVYQNSGSGPDTSDRLKFPTAISYSKDGVIGDLGISEEYEFNGRKYIVGDFAKQARDIFSTRNMDFLLMYAPLLAYKTLIQTSRSLELSKPDSINKQLCVGVPLGYYDRKNELKNRLVNFAVSNDNVQFEVEVRAQGQGILFDYMLDRQGRPINERINQNLLIVDIGFNTVDVLGVIEGRPNKEWSDMVENSGICRICEEVQAYLKREIHFDLPEQIVKDVISSSRISLYGNKKDVSVPVRKAKELYSDRLNQEIKTRWDPFLKRADKLIIAGGGAYYMDNLQEIYPRDFIYVPDEPEYCNARGFLKYMKSEKSG